MSAVRVMELVAEAWNALGIRYAVAHGIDDYPGGVGRDLDVLVAAEDLGRALRVAGEALVRAGMTVGEPSPIWGPRLIASPADRSEMLEIHLVPALSWRNVMLAERPRPSERRGPFQVDPWVSFAKRILMPLLAGPAGKLVSRPAEFRVTAGERAVAAARLAQLLGSAQADALLAAVDRGSVHDAAALMRRQRMRLVARLAARHPLRSARLLARSALRRLAQPFAACSPVVAITGSDDTGRERLLQDLRHLHGQVFTSCVVRRVFGTRNEGGVGGPSHWPATVALWLRASALRWGKDRLDSSRQRLVLYDGWASAIPASLGGSGPTASRGAALLQRWLAAPDLVLVIDDPRRPTAYAGVGDADRTIILDPTSGPEHLRQAAMRSITSAFLLMNPPVSAGSGRHPVTA